MTVPHQSLSERAVDFEFFAQRALQRGRREESNHPKVAHSCLDSETVAVARFVLPWKMAPTVASNPVRTPKAGLLRKWILMDNRKKILLVAAVAILSFATFRNVFFTETQHTYSVAHVLTAGEF
jgi:hypothetical protein